MNPLTFDGLVTQGDRAAWAVTSPGGAYRYALGRCWEPLIPFEFDEDPLPVFSVFAINPSRARHDVDDPTMRKLVHFAKQEGCGALLIRNLFAFSSVVPSELLMAQDAVGERNLEVLSLDIPGAIHVAAWGNLPNKRLRDLAEPSKAAIWALPLQVFGLNDGGEPKHPLYLANKTRLMPWAKAAKS